MVVFFSRLSRGFPGSRRRFTPGHIHGMMPSGTEYDTGDFPGKGSSYGHQVSPRVRPHPHPGGGLQEPHRIGSPLPEPVQRGPSGDGGIRGPEPEHCLGRRLHHHRGQRDGGHFGMRKRGTAAGPEQRRLHHEPEQVRPDVRGHGRPRLPGDQPRGQGQPVRPHGQARLRPQLLLFLLGAHERKADGPGAGEDHRDDRGEHP